MPPRVEHWLEPAATEQLDYAAYWNDESIERSKEWFVQEQEDFERMEAYLGETGLLEDLRAGLREAEAITGRPLSGVGADLAAGTLWAAPHLLAAGAVELLYCVEYSHHRLLKLGPTVLRHYGVPDERVVLALGSFYELQVDDGSLDFVFMSQALHHADEPDRLLGELARVLGPAGVAIVVGEHIVSPRMYAVQAARKLAARAIPGWVQRRLLGHRISPGRRGFVPEHDPVTGDHYYGLGEYRRMFERHDFRHRRLRRRGSSFQGFVLWRG